MNAVQTFTTLFTEPSRAYRAIEERGHAWFPILLIMASALAFHIWYFNIVDINWLVEHMVNSNPNQSSPEQRTAAKQMFTQSTLLWGGIGGIVIGTPLILAVFGLYYLLVGKTLGTEHSYGQWFSFISWSSLPMLLSTLVRAIQLALSDSNQVAQESLNALSLNELFVHAEVGTPWKLFADSLDLTALVCLALTVIGLKVWTKASTAACLIAALIPSVLIYGIWALRIVSAGE